MLNLGAGALFILLFFSFGRLTDFVLAGFHLPLVFSLICLVAAILNQSILVAFRSRAGIALTAFSIWLVLAIPFSIWKGGSFQVVSDGWAKSFSLFVVTAALLPSLRQSTRAVKVLAWAYLCTSVLAFVSGRFREGRFGLSQGLYMGSNELATAMAQGCIFWWFMIHNPARAMPKRVLSVIPLVPLIFIMVQTASRAGLIVLAVIVTMTFFHYSMQGRVALTLVVVLTAAAGISLAPGTAMRRFSTIFGSGDDVAVASLDEAVGSSAQRAYLLKRSVELSLEHPLFGVGPGNFSVAENALSQEEGVRAQWLGTHNTYTQISSEGGIPALLFFLASLFFGWRELRAAEKIHRSLSHPNSAEYLALAYTLRLALLSYAVFFCFEHIAYDPFYPALAGIIVAFSLASRTLVSQPGIQLPPAALVMRPSIRATRR